MTLVPLDASNQAQVDMDFYTTLMSLVANPGGNAFNRAVAAFILAGLSTQLQTIAQPEGSVNGYYLWEPLAAVALTDTQNQIVQTTSMQLGVNLTLDEEHDTSGALVTNGGASIDVVTTVDALAAKTALPSTWTGLATNELLSIMPRKPPQQNEAAAEVQEGQVDVVPAFFTDAQPLEVVDLGFRVR